jgi:8-oxo-dGTP pyrophosphatase MutT (NUDIX family)
MKINQTMNYLGQSYDLEYQDADDFSQLPVSQCTQVYGVCLYNGQVVLGFSRRMQQWSLIGGTIEPHEKFEATLIREVKEESNMKVIKYWPIGYQKFVKTGNYQLRYACLVEPYGPFIADPSATDHIIKPADFKKYIKWGKIGDRLIARALEKA